MWYSFPGMLRDANRVVRDRLLSITDFLPPPPILSSQASSVPTSQLLSDKEIDLEYWRACNFTRMRKFSRERDGMLSPHSIERLRKTVRIAARWTFGPCVGNSAASTLFPFCYSRLSRPNSPASMRGVWLPEDNCGESYRLRQWHGNRIPTVRRTVLHGHVHPSPGTLKFET